MATTPEIEVSWEDYLAIALRRKWFFLVPLTLCLVAGAVYASLAPKYYLAKAVILVQNETLINPLIKGLAMPTEVADRLGTLREEIVGWDSLVQLIRAHNLDAGIPKDNPLAFERVVKQLRADITVKMRGRALIQVSYEGRDPGTVQQMVNSLADIVIDRDKAIKAKEAQTAIGFIEAELGVYRQKLEESDRKLREFKELYMTQMPVATALNRQLQALELQLSTLLIDNTQEHPRVQEVKRQIEEVRRQRDEEVKRLVAKGVITEESPQLYQEVLEQLSAPQAAVGAGVVGSQPGHPITKAQETYASIVEGLEAPEVMAPSAGSQVEITPEGTTIQMSDATAASLTLSPRQQQELARLTRDQSVDATIYRGLLEKLERAKITGRLGEDEQGGKFVIIERARYPLNPVRPDFNQIMAIVLLFGIVLGIGAVVAAEYLDQAIQTAEEAAGFLGVPALGAIPLIVTQADLEARRQTLKSRFSVPNQLRWFRARVTDPIWSRVDKALVRWGL